MRNPVRMAALGGLLILTAFAYWPGLDGPFLFDDHTNLEPVKRWLAGEVSWQQVVLTNNAGPGGRSLSMASFVLNATVGGFTPHAFKLGNLLLHLCNGILVYLLFHNIASRDSQLRKVGAAASLALTAVWLLHPLLVSTVLYSVQRMAMLSATFVLLALIAYWHGRIALEAGRARRGTLLLFGAVPLLTVLAIASKESGVLAPLLCAVLELAYFSPHKGKSRSFPAKAFLVLGVALPLLAGGILVLLLPQSIMAGYDNRPFTLSERLMTQPRVLFDYVGSLLLPWGPRLSLYRDDYAVSTGLLSPVTTALALAGWMGLLAIAVAVRRRIPAMTAGLGLFLVGHITESSVIPLLMYFEHRNYLPSIGIVLATGGLLVTVGSWIAPRMHHPRRVFAAGTVLIVFALGTATHARAWIWRDKASLFESAIQSHPDSRWLRMEMAHATYEQSPPDYDTARVHFNALASSDDPSSRQIGILGIALLDCKLHGQLIVSAGSPVIHVPTRIIEADLYTYIQEYGRIRLAYPCIGASPGQVAGELSAWLDASPQPESLTTKWKLRYLASLLYANSGDLEAARQQAQLAWDTGIADAPVGGLLVQLQVLTGHDDEARRLIPMVLKRLAPFDQRGREILMDQAEKLDNGTTTNVM